MVYNDSDCPAPPCGGAGQSLVKRFSCCEWAHGREPGIITIYRFVAIY